MSWYGKGSNPGTPRPGPTRSRGRAQTGPGRGNRVLPKPFRSGCPSTRECRPLQLKAFYLDLQDERLTHALGIVHSRFSTNTFPSWRRRTPSGALPTTARSTPSPVTTGCARGRRSSTPTCSAPLRRRQDRAGAAPPRRTRRRDAPPGGPAAARGADDDPQAADQALHRPGRLHQQPRRHGRHVPFTDGTVIGAVSSTPQRAASVAHLGHQGRLVVMASEAVLAHPSTVVEDAPSGRMFLVDTAQGRSDDDMKAELAGEQPYQDGRCGPVQNRRSPGRRPPTIGSRCAAAGVRLQLRRAQHVGCADGAQRGRGAWSMVRHPRAVGLPTDSNHHPAVVRSGHNCAPSAEEVVTSLQGTVGAEGDLLNRTRTRAARSALVEPDPAQRRTVPLTPTTRSGGRTSSGFAQPSSAASTQWPAVAEGLKDVRAKVSSAITALA